MQVVGGCRFERSKRRDLSTVHFVNEGGGRLHSVWRFWSWSRNALATRKECLQKKGAKKNKVAL